MFGFYETSHLGTGAASYAVFFLYQNKVKVKPLSSILCEFVCVSMCAYGVCSLL